MLSLYKTLKSKNYYTSCLSCELLLLLAALITSTDVEQKIEYCDDDSWQEFFTGGYKLKSGFFSYTLQLVLDLIPILINNKMYARATNLLERTYFIFKYQLKDIKRIGFITNLFIHGQYDVLTGSDSEYCEAVSSIWNELWNETKLHKTPVESRHYLYFAGIFQADFQNRFGNEMLRNRVLLKVKDIDLEEENRLHSSFLKPMNSYQSRVANTKIDQQLELKLDPDLKTRVYWGVGGDRVFQKRDPLTNEVTRKWSELLSEFLLTNQ